MRTLRPAGKLEQLTHAMSRYHWNIVGLCEMRWKNFGKMSTDDGHKVFFSGEEGKHEYGVRFLVHKDVVGTVLGCQPVSSRLISIRLRAAPFNITIIQVYAPTSGNDDSEVDHLYRKLQKTIDQTPKKDILVLQWDWNAKVGKDAQADWEEVCGPYCSEGWLGGAMVLGKLPVPGRPTIWITVGQGRTALAVCAGGGCLHIFTLIYPFSPLSPALWETARYRLKYCLKGPLNPKQPTNQPTAMWRQMREVSGF